MTERTRDQVQIATLAMFGLWWVFRVFTAPGPVWIRYGSAVGVVMSVIFAGIKVRQYRDKFGNAP
jgi:hypothetical protein